MMYLSSTWFVCCVSWVLAYVAIVYQLRTEPRGIIHPWIVGFYWGWEVLHATRKYGTSTFSSKWLRAFSFIWALLDLVTVVVLLRCGYLGSTSLGLDWVLFTFGLATMFALAWLEGPPTRHSKYSSIPVTALCMLQLTHTTLVSVKPPAGAYAAIAWFMVVGNITGAMTTWHKMPWGRWGKLSWILVGLFSLTFAGAVHMRRAGLELSSAWPTELSQFFPFSRQTAVVLILSMLLILLADHYVRRPRPPQVPIVDPTSWRDDPVLFLQQQARTFGKSSYAFKKGNQMHLVVQDPKLLKQVFRQIGVTIDRYPSVGKRDLRGRRSLEFLVGQEHRQMKAAVVSALNFSAFRCKMSQFYALACEYTPKLNDCDLRSCKLVLRQFAIECVSVVLFGERLSSEELERSSDLFQNHFDALSAVRKTPFDQSIYDTGMEAKASLQEQVRNRLTQMRQLEEAGSAVDKESCLYKLAHNPSVPSDDDLVENLLMVWAAGFEAVRSTLMWMLAFLGSSPSSYNQVVQEVESVCKEFAADNWNLDSSEVIFQATQRMQFTEGVFQETLRMQPPAPYVTFGVNSSLSYTTVGPYTVPASWRILCAFSGMSANDELFSDSANFCPGRFKDARGIPPGFTPFGGGLRVCPARFFVKFEVLAFFLGFFREHRPVIRASINPRPDRPNPSPSELQVKVPIKKDVVFVCGPPGVGKGYVCKRLVEEANVTHLSVGDILRASKGAESEAAIIDQCMKQGTLVPAEIILKQFCMAIKDAPKGKLIVVDGFPRTCEQLEEFYRQLNSEVNIRLCLAMKCTDEVCLDRIRDRARTDETEEIARVRLKDFRMLTQPVIKRLHVDGLVQYLDTNNATNVHDFAEIVSLAKELLARLDHQPNAHTGTI